MRASAWRFGEGFAGLKGARLDGHGGPREELRTKVQRGRRGVRGDDRAGPHVSGSGESGETRANATRPISIGRSPIKVGAHGKARETGPTEWAAKEEEERAERIRPEGLREFRRDF